ncbi:relaxase/mobilization nuclease domain-containing protein [Phenylobacterium sp.]|uniref:relaxase/mobilization nuclease domain-containing protein n=1 Tax=Phenylobacterium sp. TaxID=1871053 RepID=UPI0035B477D0
MTDRSDEGFRVRPGRIRSGPRAPTSFVGQVMQAAKAAGHTGRGFGGRGGRSASSFGRGRAAAAMLALRSSSRRVVTKARVVRHRGRLFRAAPLARHILYLARDGAGRHGTPARMFDAAGDTADEAGFAERTREDRHHFRFIVSPEDADQLGDLRAFTRDLMADAERDLGTRLDWIAVDHWNTDNPHVHLLVRGRADDGRDLVIGRDYISRGLRDRAARRVTLELGPRPEHEVSSALAREVKADRFTRLDQALQGLADAGGVLDLRPGETPADERLRALLLGRAGRLEQLGLAEPLGPARWGLQPGLADTLRALGRRGDIIATLHRTITAAGREADAGAFAIHEHPPVAPIVGRLAARGLKDELTGEAYAVVEGLDGRTHHLGFTDLERTGDAQTGAIVEARAWIHARGEPHAALAVRSDLNLHDQVIADGATWLDRQLVTPAMSRAETGFGAEVSAAMAGRIDHLATQGLAERRGDQVCFAPALLATLRRRELAATNARLEAETGLPHRPGEAGDSVSGVYRQRVILASGRFAMIDDGLGFQLVPWRPALEARLGQPVNGLLVPGGVDWDFARKRGRGL